VQLDSYNLPRESLVVRHVCMHAYITTCIPNVRLYTEHGLIGPPCVHPCCEFCSCPSVKVCHPSACPPSNRTMLGACLQLAESCSKMDTGVRRNMKCFGIVWVFSECKTTAPALSAHPECYICGAKQTRMPLSLKWFVNLALERYVGLLVFYMITQMAARSIYFSGAPTSDKGRVLYPENFHMHCMRVLVWDCSANLSP
jgi:hypothetical protein